MLFELDRAKSGAKQALRRVPRALVLAVAVLACAAPQAAGANAGFSWTPSRTRPYATCGHATRGHFGCFAILVPSATKLPSSGLLREAAPKLLTPAFTGSGVGGGYSPSDLDSAYDLPSATEGSGQTVGIVDAYNDPNAESDLATYRSRYGLSACTTGNGCFKKVNQAGGTSPPASSPGWSVEISLDLDMVSAACPNCHILLVEATNANDGNLFAAEDEAAKLGATEISNSWGGEEFSEETSYDSYFHHSGVPVTVAAGDEGYGAEYPAASDDVIAVGGTSLTQASNARGWTESAWSGSGGGCSAYEPKPAWQSASPLCPRRTDNDVAAVASTKTPVSVADSYKLPSEFSKPEAGWTLVAGTSVAAPLVAGIMALTNSFTRSFAGADALYAAAAQNGTGVLDDVTSGVTGTCGDYLCEAGPGYDGPTGLGSPYGAPEVRSEAPTVEGEPPGAVTTSAARLTATVNPHGIEVSSCEFEYGTTTAFGTHAPCSPAPGDGGGPVTVTAAIGGLATNTTYYFRIDATNSAGATQGATEQFTTQPDAPTVQSEAASSITQTGATLNAEVNPNGAKVTSCELEYGTSLPSGTTVSCTPTPGSGTTPVAVSGQVTGLTADTAYQFRVIAANAGGTSTSASEKFTSLPDPPAVQSEAASSITQAAATLNAKVNPNGANVTSCVLEYGTSLPSGTSVACTPTPGSGTGLVAVSGQVTGLTADTTYQFRVIAGNAGGTSTSASEKFTTLADGPTVQTEAASSITQVAATLNAKVNPGGANVTSCELEYGTSLPSGTSVPCTPTPGSGTGPVAVSGQVTGLAADTSYQFRVIASNAGGTSTSASEKFTTLPDAPALQSESASSITKASATLNARVNPNGANVTSCEFEYGTSLPSGTIVACTPTPGSGTGPVAVSGQVTGLVADTTYKFRVIAANAGGTAESAVEQFTTTPNAPVVQSEAASLITQSGATLNAKVNPNGAKVTSCELEYGTSLPSSTSAACTPTPGSGSSPVTVSAQIAGLAANTTYQFRIIAANAGGASTGATESFKTLNHSPPEFGECLKVAAGTGHYSSAACTKPGGKDDYEWDYGVVGANHFTTRLASGSVTLQRGTTAKVVCAGEAGTGEFSGLNTVGAAHLILTGCESAGQQCTSPGAAAGEVVTHSLDGVLGIYQLGATSSQNKIALRLAASEPLGSVAQMTCGSATIVVNGSVLVPVKANKMTVLQSLKFKASKGSQDPDAFLGEAPDELEASLNSGPFEPAVLSASLTLESEAPIEINSVL